ncbi:hypothetical protein QLQ12_37770 [Actinoplanes sp. NEAU-A12]|uniref:Transposase n=1 Tax=Actinoplanes sandaracinus TaxID=3045177 RepID=A0ABT6WX93_9ACTN|nr:hypothetical protein [Actinoplanes sandaracinus]MDI6104355.1 hypothetical protein [Actinoplanes sandaracinus]
MKDRDERLVATAGRDDDDLVKLTVHLLPEAWAAVRAASVITGDTRTDCINRAQRFYSALVHLAAEGGGRLTFHDRDGLEHHVYVWSRRKRRRAWLRFPLKRPRPSPARTPPRPAVTRSTPYDRMPLAPEPMDARHATRAA